MNKDLVTGSLNSNRTFLEILRDFSLKNQEELTNVDSVEGGRVSQGCLITVENGSFTRECDNGVDTRGEQLISLFLGGVVAQLHDITDLTSLESSR